MGDEISIFFSFCISTGIGQVGGGTLSRKSIISFLAHLPSWDINHRPALYPIAFFTVMALDPYCAAYNWISSIIEHISTLEQPALGYGCCISHNCVWPGFQMQFIFLIHSFQKLFKKYCMLIFYKKKKTQFKCTKYFSTDLKIGLNPDLHDFFL
jgi:hypothetical protein